MVKSNASSKSSLGASPLTQSRSFLGNTSKSSLEALSNLATTNINEQTRARQRAAERDQKIRQTAGQALDKQSILVDRIEEELPKDTIHKYELCTAETVLESNTVFEVTRHMAAKKLHYVLIVDVKGELVGILTDRDLAFRVVAEGLEPRKVSVSTVMTQDPLCVVQSTVNMIEALSKMVTNHFRHLPVKEGDRLIGVLDITQCLCDALQKLELADAAATQIASAIESVREFQAIEGHRGSENGSPSAADKIRERLECPKVGVLIRDARSRFPRVSAKSTVMDAVRAMRAEKKTAVLVTGGQKGGQDLVGIFTTKDVLLRVVAAGQDPSKTTINRVMTPYPDSISPDDNVVNALRQMQSRHYLHLPVVDPRNGRIEGVLDVLQLTWSMLEQLSQLDHITQEPLWHQLWAPLESNFDISTFSNNSASEGGLERQITSLPAHVLFKIKYGEDVCMISADNAFNLPSLPNIIEKCRDHFKLNSGDNSSELVLNLIDEDGEEILLKEDHKFHSLVQALLSSGRERVNLSISKQNSPLDLIWKKLRTASQNQTTMIFFGAGVAATFTLIALAFKTMSLHRS